MSHVRRLISLRQIQTATVLEGAMLGQFCEGTMEVKPSSSISHSQLVNMRLLLHHTDDRISQVNLTHRKWHLTGLRFWSLEHTVIGTPGTAWPTGHLPPLPHTPEAQEVQHQERQRGWWAQSEPPVYSNRGERASLL